MFKKIRNFLLGGSLVAVSVIVYYLQKPALTPLYDVDPPIESTYSATAREKKPYLGAFLRSNE